MLLPKKREKNVFEVLKSAVPLINNSLIILGKKGEGCVVFDYIPSKMSTSANTTKQFRFQ